jgi:hypothetical protein
MAGPWEKYQPTPQNTPDGPWAKWANVKPPLNEDDRETRASDPTLEQASFLPFSKVKGTGEVVFDSNAGMLGAIKSGFTAPGDVASGKLDPNSPEAIQRAMDFTSLATPVGVAGRAGETAIPGTLRALRPGPVKVPAAEELKAAGKAGMKEARGLGVDYSADAVKSMGDDIARSLEEDGVLAELAPKTFSVLSKIREVPKLDEGETALSPLKSLVAFRRSLQKSSQDFTNPTEQEASTRAINALDDFIVASDPSSVVAGPATAASKLVGDARGDFAADFRSRRVTDALDQSELDAAAAGSGLNLDNRTRQVLNSILKSDKKSSGYSPEEIAALEGIVKGRAGTNAARYLGNKLGGGGGLTATVASGVGMGIGGALGGPWGAAAGATALPALGASLRTLASSMTRKQARELDEFIRKRSPLYKKALNNIPVTQGPNADVRALLGRGLMAGAPGLMNEGNY